MDSDNLAEIILEGGPEDLPNVLRIERDRIADGKIKIERQGGYEHFERRDQNALTFRWTARTKIAE
ncbi:hypothetical protein HNP84_005765 [Thermocatellispora tengchongensis]|uniref:Uncharacterized protein n=1 Tax=Thermocatellispora tengchongensis TaxID=1073253 RepID=A0A840PDU9_9ACTN|nr:DUF5988 family protein [Thermocatellispora tengchongensis]MBB5136021.1 hypothetical protein [Thermocatellispora tengchongensis]